MKKVHEKRAEIQNSSSDPFWLLLLVVAAAAAAAEADEGMYTFDNPPLKIWKDRYGFEPDGAWLERVMKATVRFNNGGSGAFVSSTGLVMTNHHVGFDCIQKISTNETNYVEDGYVADGSGGEVSCPDLELNVLVSFEDVTGRVAAAAQGAQDDAAAGKLRRMETARIEKECHEKTGLRCNVTVLYGGGQHMLMRYRKHTDVRLVFAPEQQIAFFGGNHDNFTFPRYDLDVSFFRIYENAKPYLPEHYFGWSKNGAAEDELVFVIGCPGSTGRQLTVSQIEFLKNVRTPNRLRTFKKILEALRAYASKGEQQQRKTKKLIFSYENAVKAYTGLMQGLEEGNLLEKKKKQEEEFKQALKKSPQIRQEVEGAWEKIAAAQKEHAKIHVRKYIAGAMVDRSELLRRAVTVVQLTAETRKPNEERLEEYRDSSLASLELDLYSSAPIYGELEELILRNSLEEALEVLGKDDPLVKAALQGADPAAVAAGLVKTTAMYDIDFRKKLVKQGAKWKPAKFEQKINASDDALLKLALRVDPILRQLRKDYEEKVESVEQGEGKKLAVARFKLYGKDMPPDATFTLRIAFGKARGYEAEGTLVAAATNFQGLYARSYAFNGKPPFHLPERWVKKKELLDMKTPLNFVSTADTIGGNSGSPVINKSAEIVGLVFDRNIHGLKTRYYYYDDEKARAVAVHSSGIREALVSVYNASKLAAELGK